MLRPSLVSGSFACLQAVLNDPETVNSSPCSQRFVQREINQPKLRRLALIDIVLLLICGTSSSRFGILRCSSTETKQLCGVVKSQGEKEMAGR